MPELMTAAKIGNFEVRIIVEETTMSPTVVEYINERLCHYLNQNHQQWKT